MTHPFNTALTRLLAVSVLPLVFSISHADEPSCTPDGELEFICGFVDPEDLVPVEDSPWIIVSSLTPGDYLYVVDTRDRSWTALTGTNAPAESHDAERFPSCPSAPSAETVSTHGLYIESAGDGRHTLYVVVHGSRESIEVYDVDASGETLSMTRVGCATAIPRV